MKNKIVAVPFSPCSQKSPHFLGTLKMYLPIISIIKYCIIDTYFINISHTFSYFFQIFTLHFLFIVIKDEWTLQGSTRKSYLSWSRGQQCSFSQFGLFSYISLSLHFLKVIMVYQCGGCFLFRLLKLFYKAIAVFNVCGLQFQAFL